MRAKSKGKIRILFLVMLLLVFTITSLVFSPVLHARTNEETISNEQPRYMPTINDNFKDDRVIVTLNQSHSVINREVEIEDFKINAERAGLISSVNQTQQDQGDDLSLSRTKQATITDLFRINNSKNISNVDGFFQILSIKLPVKGKDKVLEAIAELEKSEIVYAAEPDYNYAFITNWTPDDTSFSANQWGLNGPNGIDAEAAWDITRGSANVRVGIMEAGFDATHNDLVGNVLTLPGGFAPTPGTNLDHGTHVAGIVGAVSNNNRGIAGVDQVSLVQLDWNNFVNALTFAANNDIWIINGSFGIYTMDSAGNITGHAGANSSYAAAIHNYGQLGGIMIFSSGNGIGGVAQNTDTNPHYLSSYSVYTIPAVKFLGITIQPARPITNVISVGAINENATRRATSNFGINSVQIYAPGTNIRSTVPTNMYANWGGTSMAAPMVTGVAALLRSFDENISVANMKAAILNNCNQITINAPGIGNHVVGSLNAHQALSSVAFTHTVSGDNATITGVNFNPTGELVIPTLLNGRTVTQIGSSAFSGQSQLTQITIPSSVTHIGSDAFKNTNNAPIYLNGRTSAPNTFNVNWNSSGNPVYLNGYLCTHSSTTLTKSDHSQHGDLCDDCRTFVNKSNHIHNHSYIPFGTAPSGVAVHLSLCKCEDHIVTPCISRMPHEPGDTVICWYCGQIFSNPILYTITLSNGEAFVSNVPFTYEMYKELSNDIGVSYSYYDFIFESKTSQMINLEIVNEITAIIPDKREVTFELYSDE